MLFYNTFMFFGSSCDYTTALLRLSTTIMLCTWDP